MKYHFAIPSPRTYLDRMYAYIEADPACTIWMLRQDATLAEPLGRHARLFAGRPVYQQIGRAAAWWRLRKAGLDGDAAVLYAMFGLFDHLHRWTRKRSNVLNVHFTVVPSPSWFDDQIVPPRVRDAELMKYWRKSLSMERRAQRHADAVVVQADSYRELYARATGKPVSSYYTIPNAVVAQRLVAAGEQVEPWLQLAQRRPLLVFVGTPWKYKGVHDLLQAFARLPARHAEAALAIVGQSRHSSVRAQIDGMISDLRLTDRVHCTRGLPQPQVFALLQASRGMVFPSYMEGMPRVVLEAMDLGIPVAASLIAGIRDIDPGGESLHLFPPGDLDAVAAAMEQLLDGGASVSRRVERGRQIIETNHRPAVVGLRIRQVCEQALRCKQERA